MGEFLSRYLVVPNSKDKFPKLFAKAKWRKALEVIMVALEQAEISPGIRAEQLAIGQFAALAEALPR